MTKLVGILNLTPDSFSDGGQYVDPARALAHAEQLFANGATLIDVGAESTRPGATALTPEAEWQRLEPVLPELLKRYPNKIMLDSYHPETIDRALGLGSVYVNDITGLSNPAMVDVIVLRDPIGVVISHLPATTPAAAHAGELVASADIIVQDLLGRAQTLRQRGYDVSKIVLDPGIGFGKTPDLNRELLQFARLVPEYDVMIGYSRKRFLGEDRMDIALNLAAGREAVQAGAVYLRVHDVDGHAVLHENR